MSHTVFLDESGDLGFKFTRPYLRGGSSRFLTMAFIVVPNTKKMLLKRIVRKTYKKYGFQAGSEVKGSDLTVDQKSFVCNQIVNTINKNPEIAICAITVRKENVLEHIRRDPNLLYNFMMKLSVLDKIDTYKEVILLRDNKTVKIASGNSLIEYLQTTLFFEHSSPTILIDSPEDSKKWLALILVDWLNNIVFGHYEHRNSVPFRILSPLLKNQTLFY